MAANDGRKLLVFGLGFKDHDNRQMQQTLRHYQKLPSKPMNRTSLYVALTLLAKDVSEDESQKLTRWLQNGGKPDTFPFGQAPPPVLSSDPTAYGHLSHHPHPPMPVPQHPMMPPAQRHNPFLGHSGLGRAIPRRGWNDEDTFDEDELDDDEQMDDYTTYPRFLGPGRTIEDRTLDPVRVAPPVIATETRTVPSPGAIISGGAFFSNGSESEESEDSDSDEIGDLGDTGDEWPRHDTESEYDNDVDDGEGTTWAQTTGTGSATHPAPSEFECMICCETFPTSRFSRITELCKHERAKACLDCVRSSIAEPVEQGALHRIICPLCPSRLASYDVKDLATKEVYARYKYLLDLSQQPDTYVMCLGQDCGGGQVHEDDDPMMICNFCQFKTCARHKLPWHEGLTCAKFDLTDEQLARLEEEEITAKELAAITSICPNCKNGIIKLDGCNHMSCNCGKSWCFICATDWENIIRLGGAAHAAWCNENPRHVPKSKSQRDVDQKSMETRIHGRPITNEERFAIKGMRARRVEKMRPQLAEAAEKRMLAQKAAMERQQEHSSPGSSSQPPKKKAKLVAPWKEGGTVKKVFN
ncbi:hypothetical protein BJ878DRAFT_239004 [Calycina marina]|uniref:RBR-type E3 ubiquitin transferase n=1 Tax=Calycina marina TaxID=1763456 RepID=A0A9P7Z8U2_9HELO|nr:hypothetical protein BJ878DRAFT_239004 [Calycina marina]